jgi:mannose-6-phosphate isomerase
MSGPNLMRGPSPLRDNGVVTSDSERVRPWGYYDVHSDEADHKVKTIVVNPGKRLSLQRHSRRSEHWFVVRGDGVVTLNDEEIVVARGVAVDVALGAAHRISNTGDVPLVFVEIQHGDYFGEDDIVRLDDDFGRVESGPLGSPRP